MNHVKQINIDKRRERRNQRMEIKTIKNNIREIDDNFVYKTGPRGGAKIFPDYIRKGDGFEAVIHVYEYPKNVPAGWMNRFKQQGIVVNISVTPQSQALVMENINKSMNEHLGRVHDPKNEIVDKIKSGHRYQELTELVGEIDGAGEIIVKVAVRLHLFEKTLAALDDKINQTLEKLKGYSMKAVVLINEQENEMHSIFRATNRDNLYGRKGIEMPALTFAAGFPFSYSQLNDPRGMPLGFTDDGGAFLIDFFYRTATRGNYNACLLGLQRSGKSTLLKKMLKFFELMNDRTRVLDPVGEFADIALMFGGKVVNLDGSGQDAINPLEFRIDIETSLSKSETFLRYLVPSLNDHEIALFGEYLNKIYQIGDKNPIFSDIAKLIEDDLKNHRTTDHLRNYLENLQIQINSIASKYGQLFNRKSTINTLDEDMVVYTLRNIMSLADNIKQAQMFNITSLLWQELIILGGQEKQRFEAGTSIDDIRNFAIIIDEAHHLLKSSNTAGLDFLVTIEREAPKYFGGLIFATHMLSDVVSGIESEHFKKVEALFQLTQYKILMKLDANELGTIQKVFKNQITPREMSAVPDFKVGQALVNIAGDANYRIKVYASVEELALFKGGK